MVYEVAYFTRTNTSKRVAEKIAPALSCPCIQITDDKNWNGIFGYIKAGFYSTVHKSVAIEVHGTVEDADEIIFVAPLWAGGLAPAAIAFLESIPREKVHLVVVSLGSHVKDRAGFKSIHDITDQAGNEDVVIDKLVREFKAQAKK
ncbi:hypothetical protein JR338_12935 (plasmid) [Chloroflexota bacterium]|nr:hypothetical protein JR338_12935 [Chloroflexota bacterium]